MNVRSGIVKPAAVSLLPCVVWLVLSLLNPAPAVAQPAGQPPSEQPGKEARPTLTVYGQGEVMAAPDEAVVSLGAVAQAAVAKEAQDQVNQTVQKITDSIRKLGIPTQNIRTSNLMLQPVYGGEAPPDRGIPSEPRIVGYRASNTVEVTVDEVRRAGDVVDAGIQAGANQLEGLQFRLKNDSAQRQEALRKAVSNGKEKAQAMANALGVLLVGLAEVIEGSVQVYPMMREYGRGGAVGMDASNAIEPGQQRVSASVTLTYRIAPAE